MASSGISHKHMARVVWRRVGHMLASGDACQMRQSDMRMNAICIFSHAQPYLYVMYYISQFPNMTYLDYYDLESSIKMTIIGWIYN